MKMWRSWDYLTLGYRPLLYGLTNALVQEEGKSQSFYNKIKSAVELIKETSAKIGVRIGLQGELPTPHPHACQLL